MKWITDKLWLPINIIVFGLFCIVLPIAVWKGFVTLDPTLRLLAVLVSWPVAIVIISLVFFDRFRGAIDHFLRNVRSVQFPGGNVQVQSPDIGTSSGEAEGVVLTPEQRDALVNYIAELEQKHTDVTTNREQLQQQLQSATVQMFVWKFRFLDAFYVMATKQVLLWFASTSPQTCASFHQTWQRLITDANQRTVILGVLFQYGMLRPDGELIRITQEGYGFLQFVGLIPYAPTQSGG